MEENVCSMFMTRDSVINHIKRGSLKVTNFFMFSDSHES